MTDRETEIARDIEQTKIQRAALLARAAEVQKLVETEARPLWRWLVDRTVANSFSEEYDLIVARK